MKRIQIPPESIARKRATFARIGKEWVAYGLYFRKPGRGKTQAEAAANMADPVCEFPAVRPPIHRPREKIKDGVYVDASRCENPSEDNPACYGIAAVLVEDEKVVAQSTRRIPGDVSIGEAERQAVLLGSHMFPGHSIYTDSEEAKGECGAIWIPRSKNAIADRLSRMARIGKA